MLGNSIALYNPPIRVAEEFAMLDCISGGRLVAGFPVGTSMDTNFCYGQIPALTREKYAEAHDLIIKAWTTREPFAFNGRYNKLRHVNIWPRPIQQPHPPIHIPGGGSVETYDFCIDNTYSYSYLSFTGYIRAKALMDGYWERVAERGAPDTSPYRAGFAQTICVAETDEEAERLYWPSTSTTSTIAACTSIRASPTRPAIARSRPSRPARSSQYAPPRGGFAELTWKDLIEGGHVIAGSPETVRQRMEELIKGLHVGNVFCLMHVGDMPTEKCMYSTKLFAEKVMPKLRDMFPECADDEPLLVPSDRQARDARLAARAADRRAGLGAAPTGSGRVRVMAMELEDRRDPPRAGPLPRGRLGRAAGVPARRRRHDRGRPVARRAGRAASTSTRRYLPGYGETEECGDAARHARLHAARLGRGRGAGAEEPDPGRPLDGRHDRRGDGGAGAQRRLAPGADLPGGPVARRASDRRHLLAAAVRDAGLPVPRSGGGRGDDDARASISSDPKFLQDYLVRNARQLGMAGKLLFPVPERGLAERLYRVKAKTVVIWGESDKLIPPVYGPAFSREDRRRRRWSASPKPATW